VLDLIQCVTREAGIAQPEAIEIIAPEIVGNPNGRFIIGEVMASIGFKVVS
jgi:hypothetical protein